VLAVDSPTTTTGRRRRADRHDTGAGAGGGGGGGTRTAARRPHPRREMARQGWTAGGRSRDQQARCRCLGSVTWHTNLGTGIHNHELVGGEGAVVAVHKHPHGDGQRHRLVQRGQRIEQAEQGAHDAVCHARIAVRREATPHDGSRFQTQQFPEGGPHPGAVAAQGRNELLRVRAVRGQIRTLQGVERRHSGVAHDADLGAPQAAERRREDDVTLSVQHRPSVWQQQGIHAREGPNARRCTARPDVELGSRDMPSRRRDVRVRAPFGIPARPVDR
jgi:hypothetical protein